MKHIPIREAREIGKRLGATRVVLVLQAPEGRQHVVTWGKKYDDCKMAALVGNRIKKFVLGWPDELCYAKPVRQIREERKRGLLPVPQHD